MARRRTRLPAMVSSDATWLPHYPISYLNGITDYLNLFEVEHIKGLPVETHRRPAIPLFEGEQI
jgi:hypothetical protein